MATDDGGEAVFRFPGYFSLILQTLAFVHGVQSDILFPAGQQREMVDASADGQGRPCGG